MRETAVSEVFDSEPFPDCGWEKNIQRTPSDQVDDGRSSADQMEIAKVPSRFASESSNFDRALSIVGYRGMNEWRGRFNLSAD